MADYTTTAAVKLLLGITDSSQDAKIAALITEQSAVFDKATGRAGLLSATVTDEAITSLVDQYGHLQLHVKRPPITVVSAVAYRYLPSLSWVTLGSDLIAIDPTAYKAVYWGDFRNARLRPFQVQMTYTGGYATVPEDVNLAVQQMVAIVLTQPNAGAIKSISVGDISETYGDLMNPRLVQDTIHRYRLVTW